MLNTDDATLVQGVGGCHEKGRLRLTPRRGAAPHPRRTGPGRRETSSLAWRWFTGVHRRRPTLLVRGVPVPLLLLSVRVSVPVLLHAAAGRDPGPTGIRAAARAGADGSP